MNTSTQINPSRLKSSFLTQLRLENKSPGTVYRYDKNLSRFLNFCENLKAHPTDIARGEIIQFVGSMEKLKPRTVNTVLSAVSSFYDFLGKESHVPSNPIKTITRPQLGTRNPVYPSIEEVDQLQNYIRNNRHPIVVTAIELAAQSGLRVSELVKIHYDDIKKREFEGEEYFVIKTIGKGDKERMVPIKIQMKEKLDELKKVHKEEGLKTTWFFPSPRDHSKHISIRQMQRYFETSCKKAQITFYSAHKFRHFYATQLYQTHNDPFLVKEMLGHASVSTTEIYTHVNVGHMAKRMGTTVPQIKEGN